ncbi:MAG: hypothetical protein WA154_07120 [Moraxellaceae bacterium]
MALTSEEVFDALETCLDLLSLRSFESVVKQMLLSQKDIWLSINGLSLKDFHSETLEDIRFLWTDCPAEYDENFVFIIFMNLRTTETRAAIYNKSLLFNAQAK